MYLRFQRGRQESRPTRYQHRHRSPFDRCKKSDPFGAGHPHGRANDDENATQSTCHNAAKTIRDSVPNQSTECGKKLHHGNNVGLLGRLLLDMKCLFKSWCSDRSGDNTFVHASTCSQETHGEHSEEQSPVECLRRHLVNVTQLGRHPSFAWTGSCHDENLQWGKMLER